MAAAMASISSSVAESPVRWPVAMTASASKKARSRVSSAMVRSAVMAWAPCLTWKSAKTLTSLGLEGGAVAEGLGGLALDQALVGDVGVGPLVDADEAGAGGGGDGEGGDGGVGEDVDAEGDVEGWRDAVGDDGEAGGGLGADVAGLAEGDVAVVLDDEAVHAAGRRGPRRRGGRRRGWRSCRRRGSAGRRGGAGRGSCRSAPCGVPKISPTALAGLSEIRRHARGSMRVHVIGNVAFDETLAVGEWPAPGASILCRPVAGRAGRQGAEPGGGAGAGRGGVRLVAGIGEDARGAAIRAALAAEPLALALVAMPGRATDCSIVLSAPDGDNCNITTTECAGALGPSEVRGGAGRGGGRATCCWCRGT